MYSAAVTTEPNARRRKPRPSPERVAAAQEKLFRSGMTVQTWATAHGYEAEIVYKVLSGRRACTTGASHKIAVALGLKDGEA